MTDPRQRPRSEVSTGALAMSGERDRVLARRRLALIGLGAAVPVTLGAAIITGSIMFLVISLVFDLLIGGYIAVLLQIKQAQDGRGGVAARPQPARQDVRLRS